jgi:hypothetical protein
MNPRVTYQLTESTIGVLGQLLRIANLDNLSLVHSDDSVAVHNSLDPMGNIDQSLALQILIQILNDLPLLLQIDVACSFIDNDYLLISKDGSKDSYELLLSSTEILTSAFHSELESF